MRPNDPMSQGSRSSPLLGEHAPTILVADDDAVVRKLLHHYLCREGYRVLLAEDGHQAIQLLSPQLAVALFDLQMPGADGLECLRVVQSRFPELPAIVISQFGEVRHAVEAMKRGAAEYICKPIDADELVTRVEQVLRVSRLTGENRQLRQAVGSPMPLADFIGQGPTMQRLMQQVRKVVALDTTVLITGESGTGKSTLARHIHQSGPRREGPFVAVSCAALPRELIEAELFGHIRGAFTGAVADRPGRAEMAEGGTLFLDEIGDMPLELQPKLLAFLQERTVQRIGATRVLKVDVRVIAATHQDLNHKIREGSFRQDLFFRLNVLPLHIDCLQQRPEDISLLAQSVLQRIAKERGGGDYQLTCQAVQRLQEYTWPGNVRELENVLERSSAFCEGKLIDAGDLALPDATGQWGTAADGPATGSLNSPSRGGNPTHQLAGLTLAEIEKRALLETLAFCGGNKKRAAQLLAIDEKSVYNKMRRHGLS